MMQEFFAPYAYRFHLLSILTECAQKQIQLADNPKVVHAFQVIPPYSYDLLLPKNKIELEKLRKYISRGYRVKKITIRKNPRKIVREAIKSNQLMVALAEKFLAEKGSSLRAMTAPVREFSNWICLKLSDKKPNQVKNIVYKAHPNLVDRTSPDWWRKQIAERKK